MKVKSTCEELQRWLKVADNIGLPEKSKDLGIPFYNTGEGPVATNPSVLKTHSHRPREEISVKLPPEEMSWSSKEPEPHHPLWKHLHTKASIQDLKKGV